MPSPPPPVDCSRIIPLGSSCGGAGDGICEGCCTHVYRCRSHEHSTSGLQGCSGASFDSYPFPKCHWIGEHCSSTVGESLYGEIPAHCRTPRTPPLPPVPPPPPPLPPWPWNASTLGNLTLYFASA
eukprot:1009240-Prymnesium_polylepis.1